MARERKLTIVIAGDPKGGIAALDQLDRKLGDSETKLGRFGDKMTNFGKKMTLGVTVPAAAGAVAVFNMASDLNESLSKSAVVFEEHAARVDDWAKGLATSFGISRQEALESAGTFGNLFTALGIDESAAADMSQAMVELAADLASFNNMPVDEVLERLRSGLLGEQEAMERLGVVISETGLKQKAFAMGLVDNTKSVLPPAIKTQAAYALILEQTGKAQGDFARTADDPANKQRILTAQFKNAATTIGTKLIPIGQKLLDWASKLLDWFTKLSPKTQNFILGAIGLAAALGPVVGVLGNVVKGFDLIYAHPIIAGLALLTAGVIYAYQNWGWFRDAVDKVIDVFQFLWDEVLQPFWTDTLQPLGEFVGGAFATAWDTVKGIVEFFEPIFRGIAGALEWFLNNVVAPLVEQLKIAWEVISKIAGEVRDFMGGSAASIGAAISGTQAGIDAAQHVRSQARAVTAAGRPIPAAAGGIFPARPGGWLANIAEGGQAEAVIPLDRLGGRPSGPVTIVLELDRKTIGRVMFDTLDQLVAGGHRPHHIVTKG